MEMDHHIALRERDFEVDLETGVNEVSVQDNTSEDSIYSVKKQAKELLSKISSIFVDETNKGELGLKLCHHVAPNSNGISEEQVKSEGEKGVDQAVAEKKMVKEKRKKMSHKKSPKPPRPPRGPSLDAADQKLIKEIAELAILKRARVERMKALKKMKAAKGSSSSGNVFAMMFTIIFCLVVIFHGMSSRVTSANFQGSPISSETAGSGLIAVQYFGNPSASDLNAPSSVSPSSLKPIAGFNHPENLRRAVG